MTWLKRLLVVFAIAFSLLGAYLSTQMLLQHLYGKSSSGLLTAICGAGGGGCDKISSSRWGTIPPKPKVEDRAVAEAGQGGAATAAKPVGLHIPVPVLGLLYFSFLAAWFLGVGCPNHLGCRWQLVPFLAVLIGNGWSVFFIYLMAKVIKAWCGGCLAIHAINLLLLAIVFLTCPRRWRKTATGATDADASASPSPASLVPHPSTRLALVTLALASSFILIGALIAATAAFYVQVVVAKSVVEEVAKSPEVLVTMYSGREHSEVPASAESPCRGGPVGSPYTVVVFSDMTCPTCKTFEAFMAEKVQPVFGDHLRVVFKHFPLSDRCNRHAEAWRSAHSCTAAYAAEAARLQGGDEMFWKVLAEIRAKSDDLSSVDYAAVATRLGIKPDRLLADMQSPVVKGRIQADVELAGQLKVESTPTVFLNGRSVPRVAQDKLGFWKLVSDSFAAGKPVVSPVTSTAPSVARAQP